MDYLLPAAQSEHLTPLQMLIYPEEDVEETARILWCLILGLKMECSDPIVAQSSWEIIPLSTQIQVSKKSHTK